MLILNSVMFQGEVSKKINKTVSFRNLFRLLYYESIIGNNRRGMSNNDPRPLPYVDYVEDALHLP